MLIEVHNNILYLDCIGGIMSSDRRIKTVEELQSKEVQDYKNRSIHIYLQENSL